MKVIIILSIAMSVTLGSLEPADYKPPLGSGSASGYSTTSQSNRYLPPSLSSQLASHRSISNQGLTPESHYLPTSYQSPSQNVIPNSLYLPTSNIRSSSLSSLSSLSTLSGIPNSSRGSSGTSVVGGIPSLQYLPSQPSISRQNPFSSIQNPESITTTSTATTTTNTAGITSTLDHRISNSLGIPNTPTVSSSPTVTSRLHTPNRNTVSSGTAVSSSQYLPPSMSLVSTSKHSDRFIQSVPSSNYLASALVSKQNQYHGRINQPSSTFAVAVPGSIGLSSPPPPPSSSSSSSSSSSTSSSGIISNSYLMPNNKLSSPLSGFSSLSHNNQYTDGQPGRQSNILAGGNINQPHGNYYSPDETFSGYDNNHKALANYEFEYHVNDEYGNDFSHKETKNNDNKVTRGVYTVLLPDGRKQIVHYTADQDGFKPTITYEESPAPGYQY